MGPFLRAVAGLTLTAGLAGAAETPKAWLHLSGYSVHFHAPDANPYLLGLGLSLPAKPWGAWRTTWVLNAFEDSDRKLSVFVGRALTLRCGSRVDLGVTAALMYHRNFARQNQLRLLPVALPFVDCDLGRWTLRTYYVPPLRSPTDHQVAVQLMIPLGE